MYVPYNGVGAPGMSSAAARPAGNDGERALRAAARQRQSESCSLHRSWLENRHLHAASGKYVRADGHASGEAACRMEISLARRRRLVRVRGRSTILLACHRSSNGRRNLPRLFGVYAAAADQQVQPAARW